MPAISVTTDGDHDRVAREMDLGSKVLLHTTADWSIDALEHGMKSGATSLMVLIPVQVGDVDAVVAAETSLNVWMSATAVLAARFAAEVEQPGWVSLSPAARAILLPRMAEAVRRAMPGTTAEQASEAAEMILDGFGADGPAVEWKQG